LFDIHNKKIISAPNGDNGRTAKEYGKNGQNIYIRVPLGTSVYDKDSNELIVDITASGQEFIVAKGGRGGHGNAFFKSSFNRAPSLYERGEFGEQKNLFLKLRYLADVGIVGLPNAGKSTFIGKVANAKPKVADYQFTTLSPILGVVTHKHDKMVFSDMPGLIEGASQGKGLGHDFLKHIERCTILIHMISLCKEDNEDPAKAYQLIKNELKQYSFSLLEKPIIIVASKADVDGAKSQLTKLKKKTAKQPLFVISANKNEGIEPLLDHVFALHNEILLANKRQSETKQKSVKVIELKQQKDFSLELKIFRNEHGV
jgi:GTP-binding protein